MHLFDLLKTRDANFIGEYLRGLFYAEHDKEQGIVGGYMTFEVVPQAMAMTAQEALLRYFDAPDMVSLVQDELLNEHDVAEYNQTLRGYVMDVEDCQVQMLQHYEGDAELVFHVYMGGYLLASISNNDAKKSYRWTIDYMDLEAGTVVACCWTVSNEVKVKAVFLHQEDADRWARPGDSVECVPLNPLF